MTDGEIRAVIRKIEGLGCGAHPIPGAQRFAIGIAGNQASPVPGDFEMMPGVREAIRVTRPYELVSREATGLPIVTEAMGSESVSRVEDYAYVIQAGARNMRNFSLLKRSGKSRLPILLKHGLSATLEELLMSAEYVAAEGNHQVMLCERGVRTFADHARYTPDVSVVPAVKRASHLPILVDPSHETGRRDRVAPRVRAAVVAGAGGIMVEVHNHPERALSDGPQALLPEGFSARIREISALAPLVSRTF